MRAWLSWVPALLAAVNSISALPAAQNVFQAADDGSTRTVRAWRFNTTMPGQTQTLMKLARVSVCLSYLTEAVVWDAEERGVGGLLGT